jgi:geranylgeranyl diphosphate synthase type II
MGGLCARASEADVQYLYQFGRNAGIAFQIQDDLLDTYGDPEKFGKQTGGDILQNKKTLLVLKTLEVGSRQDRDELNRWMHTGQEAPDQKIAAVKDIYNRNGIPALIEEEKQQFQREAFRHLEAVSVPEERKMALRQVIEDLLGRES